jgi:type 1 fimbria pilin
MKKLALAIVVVLALAAGTARAAGTFSVTPATVASGGTVTVQFCGFGVGQGGYYTVSGPSVSSTRFWGAATGSGCLIYGEPTTGWAAGKYKFIAYLTDAKGHNSKIGSAVVTVTP